MGVFPSEFATASQGMVETNGIALAAREMSDAQDRRLQEECLGGLAHQPVALTIVFGSNSGQPNIQFVCDGWPTVWEEWVKHLFNLFPQFKSVRANWGGAIKMANGSVQQIGTNPDLAGDAVTLLETHPIDIARLKTPGEDVLTESMFAYSTDADSGKADAFRCAPGERHVCIDVHGGGFHPGAFTDGVSPVQTGAAWQLPDGTFVVAGSNATHMRKATSLLLKEIAAALKREATVRPA